VDAELPACEVAVIRSCLSLLASARATPTLAATLRLLGHLLGRSDVVLQHTGDKLGTCPSLLPQRERERVWSCVTAVCGAH
jgi:hypothetical protein